MWHTFVPIWKQAAQTWMKGLRLDNNALGQGFVESQFNF